MIQGYSQQKQAEEQAANRDYFGVNGKGERSATAMPGLLNPSNIMPGNPVPQLQPLNSLDALIERKQQEINMVMIFTLLPALENTDTFTSLGNLNSEKRLRLSYATSEKPIQKSNTLLNNNNMTMTQYKTISAREANELDLVPITRGYVESEYELLDKAIATLGNKTHYLVSTTEGIVIARPRKEINTIKMDRSAPY
jgi:hypothetical protein